MFSIVLETVAFLFSIWLKRVKKPTDGISPVVDASEDISSIYFQKFISLNIICNINETLGSILQERKKSLICVGSYSNMILNKSERHKEI